MAIVNRILNVLILLLAIVALVFGYKLAAKRTELRDRGNNLAKGVAGIVKELDTNSKTNVAKDVTFDEAAQSGTLGVGSADLEAAIKKANDHSKAIRAQRDGLARGISEVATELQKPVEPELLMDLSTYEAQFAPLKLAITKDRERDTEVFARVEEMAARLNRPLEAGLLLNTENPEAAKEALSGLVKEIEAINQRSDRLAVSLQRVVQKLGDKVAVNPNNLREAKQADIEAVVAAIEDISARSSQLDETKIKLEQLKDAEAEMVKKLEGCFANATILENKLKETEATLAKLARPGGPRNPGDGTGLAEGERPKSFQGHIVDVNYEFQYVIIDLGAKNFLPPNLEMTVARDREFICKISVTRIFEGYAVADILPDLKQGQVLKGDRVFFMN